ncbi:LOW QUALITY PROTEIN: transmembrane protein 212 [Mergus octosetaceus]
MTVKSLYEVTRGILITFGTISVFLCVCFFFFFFFFNGIFAFFPVFSYKPLFVGQSVCLASPIWKGALAVFAMGGHSFALGTRSTTGASVQFAVAIPSLLPGPYCSYSLAGITGTNHLGVLVPFPYTAFPNLCKDPAHSEWYHLALQVLDLCSSLAVFCAASAVVTKLTMRLLQLGHLNVSMSCDGEGGLSP